MRCATFSIPVCAAKVAVCKVAMFMGTRAWYCKNKGSIPAMLFVLAALAFSLAACKPAPIASAQSTPELTFIP